MSVSAHIHIQIQSSSRPVPQFTPHSSLVWSPWSSGPRAPPVGQSRRRAADLGARERMLGTKECSPSPRGPPTSCRSRSHRSMSCSQDPSAVAKITLARPTRDVTFSFLFFSFTCPTIHVCWKHGYHSLSAWGREEILIRPSDDGEHKSFRPFPSSSSSSSSSSLLALATSIR